MDSTEALFHSPPDHIRKCMKMEGLFVVARDGIGTPTAVESS